MIGKITPLIQEWQFPPSTAKSVLTGLLTFTNESSCLTGCASTKPPPAANGCPTVRLSRFKRAFNPCLN